MPLGRTGRYPESVECFDRAIETESTLARAWEGKAVAHKFMKELDHAEACIAKAKELAPHDPRVTYNIAGLHALCGDRAQALSQLGKAIVLEGSCREEARADPEFEDLWIDPDFKALTFSPA